LVKARLVAQGEESTPQRVALVHSTLAQDMILGSEIRDFEDSLAVIVALEVIRSLQS
jgi:hypothetical protein